MKERGIGFLCTCSTTEPCIIRTVHNIGIVFVGRGLFVAATVASCCWYGTGTYCVTQRWGTVVLVVVSNS